MYDHLFQGAFWGLMVGLVTGLIRFVLEFAVYGQPPACGSGEVDTAPDIIRKVHYLHFGCILFVVSFVVTIVVSLLTKPIDPRKVSSIAARSIAFNNFSKGVIYLREEMFLCTDLKFVSC